MDDKQRFIRLFALAMISEQFHPDLVGITDEQADKLIDLTGEVFNTFESDEELVEYVREVTQQLYEELTDADD